MFHKKITYGTFDLSQEQGVQRNSLPQHNGGKATVAVVIHSRNIEDDVGYSGELPPAAVLALQRSPAFRALFNQLGFNEEARKAATEALVSIASDSGTHCLTAEPIMALTRFHVIDSAVPSMPCLGSLGSIDTSWSHLHITNALKGGSSASPYTFQPIILRLTYLKPTILKQIFIMNSPHVGKMPRQSL